MSLSLFGSTALVVAAQFGQPGFPTLEEVEDCLPPISLMMATTAVQSARKGEDAEEAEALFDELSMANLHLLSWQSYYRGVFWDHPEFEERVKASSTDLAKNSFAFLRQEAPDDGQIEDMVAKGFACMAMTSEHTLITNSDGTSEEI